MLAVLIWIGGVGFVTLVVFPTIRSLVPRAERLAAFHRFEDRFAGQARVWVALTALSGLWMVGRGQLGVASLTPHFGGCM